MGAVFTQGRGKVAAIHEGRPAVPFRIKIDGWPNSPGKVIVTQAAIVQNDNYQFLHTLADTIYVYVFGTRIGELTVGGLAFASLCNTGGSGWKEVLDQYAAKRIAVNTGRVSVVVGDVSFKAFLTGMQAQIADPEQILTQWTFRFSVFPET